MIGKEAKEKGMASIDEVYNILNDRKKSSKPLTYEQQVTIEYAEKFKMGIKEYNKLEKKLRDLNMLSDYSIIKILEIMPKNLMMLRQIVTREKETFTDEQLSQVLNVINNKG